MLQGGHAAKPQWRDPRVQPDEECVVRALLDRWASVQPDKVFVVSPEGTSRTYAEFRTDVVRTANALRRLGVKQGEHVLVWLPNSITALRVWFAINYLGAVFVPINIAYKGNLLEHVIDNSDACLMIGHHELLPRLEGCALARLETVVSIGGHAAHSSLTVLAEAALDDASEAPPALERPIAPWDTCAILYTSGTTGKSKGVLSSYLHQAATGSVESWPILGRSDRFMICLPIFHTGATCFIYAMLVRGGSLTMVDGFRTADFWQLVNATQSTSTILLGVMAQFLLKEQPSASDRQNALQTAIIIPLAQDNAVFEQRFNVGIYTAFNQTETCVPLVSGLNPSNVTSCGKPRPSVQVRLVDENDCEVQPGQSGELIVRTEAPWSLNSGYQKNPEATAKAWRNGWFHTGDAFRKDERGYYYFVDRLKDTIRRRGENISSYEIEAEVLAFSAVREAAAVPVPSEFGEDEILIAVSAAPGERIEPAALVGFLADRVPYFMVPRYVRVLADLPRTESLKIHKSVLRNAGITEDCWDREQDASIKVKREQLTGSQRRRT